VVRALSAARPTPDPCQSDWPSVGVVIATRDRPHLLRRTLTSISEQDYPGRLRIVVVYDGVQPDWRIARGGERPILVLENWRTTGPAGARNTGILAAGDCDLVALCADDDTWHPEKLTAQVTALRRHPEAQFVTCAAEIEYDGQYRPRLSHRMEVWPADLTRARASALTPSGFVVRQSALASPYTKGGIGLFAEDAPGDSCTWDLLLRAARRSPIRHLDRPMVRVLWRTAATDPHTLAAEIHALRWMLDRQPAIRHRRRALARVVGELAGWEALRGYPDVAWAAAVAAMRACWYQPMGLLAVLAASGVLRGRALHAALRRGRLR
jgi:glycosyltransferase involved in cell wall biosynthesis